MGEQVTVEMTTTQMATVQERMATARRALERAEAAAGLRTRLATPPPAPLGAPARAHHPTPPTAGSLTPDRPGGGRDPAVDEGGGGLGTGGGGLRTGEGGPNPDAESRIPHAVDGGSTGVVGGSDAGYLPVPAALAGFFPPAGLRRGSVVQVGGSSSVLLGLLAAAQGEGWVALAALPDIGLQAAADAGLSLPRSLLVPRPGPEAASVVGALVDGVDVLAIGDCRALSARDRRLVSARLRTRGAVLLSTAHWPGADVVLRVAETRTGGLGRGWGQVQAGELTVHGRGYTGVAGRVRVRVGPGGLSALPDDGAALSGAPTTVAEGSVPAPGRPRLQAVS